MGTSCPTFIVRLLCGQFIALIELLLLTNFNFAALGAKLSPLMSP